MVKGNDHNGHRDYRKEYDNYQGTSEQIKKRASRNKARAQMIAAGKAKKGDGKDVAHLNGNALDDSMDNYALQSKKKNRSYPRTKNARKQNPKD